MGHAAYDDLSPILQAARGTDDIGVILDALDVQGSALVLALAPKTTPLTRILAALYADRTDVIRSNDMRSSPPDDIMRWSIGSAVGDRILPPWTRIAPPFWGYDEHERLIRAALQRRCPVGIAASLIGPCNESADLLSSSLADGDAIAAAINAWGHAKPRAPTWWMDHVGDRLTSLLFKIKQDPRAFARSLPWLPDTGRREDIIRLLPVADTALAAFAAAKTALRPHHREIILSLLPHARDVGALIRLACNGTHDIAVLERLMNRVEDRVRDNPHNALDIINAVQLRDLPEHLVSVICDLCNDNLVCHAIAFACGKTEDPPPIHPQAAIGIFGSMDLHRWHRLPRRSQHAWLHALPAHWGHLAVRALGPVPDALACVHDATPDALNAIRAHVDDEHRIQRLSYVLALRGAPSPIFYALVHDDATWLTDGDDSPHAILAAACGRLVDTFPAAFQSLTPAQVRSLAAPIGTLARVAPENRRTRCAAFRLALATASPDDIALWGTLIPDGGELHTTILAPYLAALCGNGASHAAPACATDLCRLEPSVAIPSLYALHSLLSAVSKNLPLDSAAGEALAESLRQHGDMFWTIIESLPTNRDIIFPRQFLQTDHALYACVLHDAHAAFVLSHALQRVDNGIHADEHAREALDAMRAFPQDTAWRVVDSLAPSVYDALIGNAGKHIDAARLASDPARFTSALDRLRYIHPSAAIPALRALANAHRAWDDSRMQRNSEHFFSGLRDHGAEAAEILRSMRKTMRERLFPSRMHDDHHANKRSEALIRIVDVSPIHAWRLAWAFDDLARYPNDPRRVANAILSLLDIPRDLLDPVLAVVPSTVRQALALDAEMLLRALILPSDDPSVLFVVTRLIHEAPVAAIVACGVARSSIADLLDDHALDSWTWRNSSMVRRLYPIIHAPTLVALRRLPGVQIAFADIDHKTRRTDNVACNQRSLSVQQRL